jgi:ribokinase
MRDRSLGTGIAIPIVLDTGQNSILSVPRANLAISAAHVESARSAIEQADVLVMQFEVSWEAILAGARIASAAGIPILLNAAPASDPPPELIAMATWLVVNEAEADALISEPDRPSQARRLRALGPATVTITLGAEGAVTSTAAGIVHTPAITAEAVDTVGAGDAFCGALAVGLAARQDLEDVMRVAAVAGGLAVTRAGAAASLPTAAAVQRYLAEGTISSL